MLKILLILAVGVAVGYSYGWKDAQVHDKAVYERIVDRVGGSNRDLLSNDVDSRMAKSEGR